MRSPKRPFASQGGVIVLAHRGFSGRYPENTMLAFEKAAELPIDGLEMDIYATRDGYLVISHDDSVERMSDGEGKIEEYNLAELKKLDAGYRFTPDGGKTYPFRSQGITIPTLREVFDTFTDLWINIDIKQHEKRVVEKFCALIEEYEVHEQLCVGSFSTETVKQFRQMCPRVVTLATLNEVGRLFLLNKLHLEGWFEGGHPIQVAPRESHWGISFELVTRRFLESAHKRNAAVHLWTINKPAKMKRYIDWGVDGIITNYPDRALELLNRMPAVETAPGD